MTNTEAICIAEEFSEWLEDMTEKYGWDKDNVQLLFSTEQLKQQQEGTVIIAVDVTLKYS